MTFKLFYTDYSKDKHVRSDEAVTETLENITGLMQSLLHEEDNFIGIIDDDNVMLQFMVDEDGSLIVDLPMHDQKGSFTKKTDLSGCIAIVNSLQGKIDKDQIEGLEFKSW
jgi:hypothetical protein